MQCGAIISNEYAQKIKCMSFIVKSLFTIITHHLNHLSNSKMSYNIVYLNFIRNTDYNQYSSPVKMIALADTQQLKSITNYNRTYQIKSSTSKV